VERLLQVLKRELKSELRSDHISKLLYSTDASIYQVEPTAILIPRSKSELVRAIAICSEYAVPIIARGAATGIAGGCLGKGLVIDTSMHLNRIVEIDYAHKFAVVQPGLVCDRLNEVLQPHGLYFAPEISSGNRCTIGGMVATGAAGSNSLKVGKIQEHIIEVELILWNGEIVRFSRIDKEGWKEKLKLHTAEGKIYRHLERIRKEYGHDIRAHFPKVPRRASGYNLDELLKEDFINVASLICGSEGTLGVISEIKVALSHLPESKCMMVIGYKTLESALKQASEFLRFGPAAVEMIDKKIIEAGRASPSMRQKLDWLEGAPDALLVVEFEGNTQLDSLSSRVSQNNNVLFSKVIEDKHTQKNVWDLRKAGLGLLLSSKSYSRALAFIEDVAVPPEKVADFVEQLDHLLAAAGKDVGIYGHVGAGCLHVRPFIDLRRPEELAVMQQIADSVSNLLLEFGGVYSGEHGDGRVRSWTNPKMFGPRLYEALTQIKQAFDPYGFMNPGKIVSSQTETPQGLLQNLRLSPAMPIKEFATYFDFSREGGLALAVDLCNGNGQCRKKDGTMCPSFQVTHDERDSTRARAQALRGLIHGQVREKEIFDEDFYKVMELCIECKGCKTECPSQVDMAKMKSEYLYQLHQRKKPKIVDRLFAHIGDLFHAASKVSWLVNLTNRINFVRKWLHHLGIASDRKLPKLAQKRFSRLFKSHVRKRPSDEVLPQVVLFVDTFTEFLHPSIGMAAVRVLEDLKYAVVAPAWKCCGRPMISKGFLPQAKKKLDHLLETLYPYAKQGIKIVGLEPSCLLTLNDELRDFGLDPEKVELVSRAAVTLDQFLVSHKTQLAELCLPFNGHLKVHGHCHQKSLVGMQAELELLKSIVTGSVDEIPSGCCGMAGSFGYEKEHSQFSRKIGELVLLPAVRQAPPETVIIASGSSCRSQIEDFTEAKPLHFIEFIARQLKSAKTLELSKSFFAKSGWSPFSSG